MTKVKEIIPVLEGFIEEQKRILGLPKNVEKNHWSTLSYESMINLIQGNIEELNDKIFNWDEKGKGSPNYKEAQERCLDIANLLMMLWDNLEKTKPEVKAMIGDDIEVELNDGTFFRGKFSIHALAGECVLNQHNIPINYKRIISNISNDLS